MLDRQALVPATILDVRRWERRGTRYHSLVLQAEDGRVLAIQVGVAEAAALALILTRTVTSRPLTFPFFAALLRASETAVRRVVVHSLVEEVFHAEVELADGTRVDARPSDALPLAAALGTPVYVAEDVLRAAGLPPGVLDRPTSGGAAEIAGDAMAGYRARQAVPGRESSSILTRREVDVLRLVADGRTNAEVSRMLGVSVHTVGRHLQNAYSKLGVSGRAQAVAHLGWVRPV
jgi:bifunctional DNase/RNase/DNA-binding CsgD family transcriptional regulator